MVKKLGIVPWELKRQSQNKGYKKKLKKLKKRNKIKEKQRNSNSLNFKKLEKV